MGPAVLRAMRITRVVMLIATAGCSRPSGTASFPCPPGRGDVSVMSFNLDRFAYADRDGDGQPAEFTPEAGIQTIVSTITKYNPDILALQEVGSANALEILRSRLAAAGCDFPGSDFLPPAEGTLGLGILSKYKIADREPVTNLTYTIKDRILRVGRGFQQVTIAARDRNIFRIINVHLKSRDYHAAGQTEMRRNEARLLSGLIRRTATGDSQTPLIVCGDFGDTPRSAALREIIEEPNHRLFSLDLIDAQGDGWTTHDRADATWRREHFIFIDRNLQNRFEPEKSGIVPGPDIASVSRHRPLVAVFSGKDQPPVGPKGDNSGAD